MNIYYSYDKGHWNSLQLEDNVTRGLSISLKNSENMRKVFFSLIESKFITLDSTKEPKFDLQTVDPFEYIDKKECRNRILVGIVPDNQTDIIDPTIIQAIENSPAETAIYIKIKKEIDTWIDMGIPGEKEIEYQGSKFIIKFNEGAVISSFLEDLIGERKSRLDALFYDSEKKWAIGIENKLYSGISLSQWKRHLSCLKIQNDKKCILSWKQIYNTMVEQKPQKYDIWYYEFIEYLEVLGLSGFIGIKPENVMSMDGQKETLKQLMKEIDSDIIDGYKNRGILLKKKGTFTENWMVYHCGDYFKETPQIGISIDKEIVTVYLLIPNIAKNGWKNLENHFDSIISELKEVYHNNPIPYLEFNFYQRHGKGDEVGGQGIYAIRPDSSYSLNFELLLDKDNSKLEHTAIRRSEKIIKSYKEVINQYLIIHKAEANMECSIDAKFYLDVKRKEHENIENGTKSKYKNGQAVYLKNPADLEFKNIILKLMKDMSPVYSLLSRSQ